MGLPVRVVNSDKRCEFSAGTDKENHLDAKPSLGAFRGLTDRLADGLTWAALSVGIAARLLQYWRQPSLWVDESMLALAIGTRRFSELAMPLEYGQMAPVGFSGIEWLALEVFGSDERALRLIPMVSGVIALVLLTVLARKVLSRAAAAVVVIGAALSPALLRGANEVKPYSSDAAIGLAIVVVALRIVEHPSSLRQWISWGVASVFGAVVSFPSILVSGATGLALLPIALDHRRIRVLGGLGAAAVLVGAVAASAVRSADLDAYMSAFWAGEFLAISQPLESLSKLGIVAGSIVARNVDRPGPAAVVFAVAAWAGAVVLARQAPRTAIIIFGPLALALGLAVTRTYPVSSRTWLFVAPLFLIGFGTLVDWVARRIPWRSWRGPRHPDRRRGFPQPVERIPDPPTNRDPPSGSESSPRVSRDSASGHGRANLHLRSGRSGLALVPDRLERSGGARSDPGHGGSPQPWQGALSQPAMDGGAVGETPGSVTIDHRAGGGTLRRAERIGGNGAAGRGGGPSLGRR